MNDAKPILIAGPTASGKSALALALAERLGGVVINADALQVYDHWRVLTARPSEEEEAQAPHRLYGHVPATVAYSVGAWLRDVSAARQEAAMSGLRPIIIGGTGLYFSALTDGLAAIPPIPPEVRAAGDAMREADGAAAFAAVLSEKDPVSWARLDKRNTARLQRAWEVLEATGRSIADWQAQTGPATLAPSDAVPICLNAERDWLVERIERRFGMMVELGALDEARAWRDRGLPGSLPAARALGAPELLAHLAGEIDLLTACERASIATRRFAKRQRTWFRNRMGDWHQLDVTAPDLVDKALALTG